MIWIKVLLFLIYLNSHSYGLYRRSNIVFENNGYKNVLIAISQNVPEDQGLISKIKTAFTATSKELYRATRKRAYFKQIVLLVPNNWANNPSYGAATTQTLQMADIVISRPIQRHQRHILTRSYSGCGQPGIHIQLLSDFFTSPGVVPNCGKPCYSQDEYIGRKLVHDWANFRWGVYNEYPSEGESQFYFSTKTGRPEAVRCSSGLRGSIFNSFPNGSANPRDRCLPTKLDPATGMYPDGCKYYPYPYRNMASASIMDHQWINDIVTFCDDDKAVRSRTAHNTEPPNKHNRLCSHRSTWDVILNTTDFKGGINSPRDIPATEQEPQFVIVKASATKRIAILMDMPSDSEKTVTKRDVHQAIATYVDKGIDDQSEVALLRIREETEILHPLTHIKSTLDKQAITDALTKTHGKPKMTSGINEALTIIQNGNNTGEKHILLLSCGNHSHIVDDVTRTRLKESGIAFNVISCDKSSHPSLVDTAQMFGGQLHHVSERLGLTSFLDGIHEISKITSNRRELEIKLFSQTIILRGDEDSHVFNGSFSVDPSLKRGMSVLITYNDTVPFITVTSPSNKAYTNQNALYKHDTNLKVIRIHIDNAETGHWKFAIRNKSPHYNLVSVVVTAESTFNDPPIELFGHVRKLDNLPGPVFVVFADISRSHNPVIGLNVTATIENPDGVTYQVQLLDNGAGADVEKDDGVYSRYFTKVTKAGHYNIKIEASQQTGNKGHFKECFVEESLSFINEPGIYNTKSKRKERSISTGLSRTTSGSVFVMEGDILQSSTHDLYPPARIIDLNVVNVSQIDRTITLTWTAPGDDFDDGTAAAYDIRYHSNGVNLLMAKDRALVLPSQYVLNGNVDNPRKAGDKELLILKFPVQQTERASFAFILRAIDKSGNNGEFSNLATAGLLKTSVTVDAVEKEKTVDEPIALLIAIVMVFLFMILIMLMGKLAYYYPARKHSRSMA